MFKTKVLLNLTVIFLCVGLLGLQKTLPASGAQPLASQTLLAGDGPDPTTPISPAPVDAPIEPGRSDGATPLPKDPSALPDLEPYTPTGWDYPIVPSSVKGTNVTGPLNTDGTYLDWSVANYGGSTTTPFSSCIYLDGLQIVCSNHSTGLDSGYYGYVLDYLYTGGLAPGNHTLELIVDINNSIMEANESNNTWSSVFTWYASSSCPPASYTPQSSEMGGTVMGDVFPPPEAVQKRIAAEHAREAASPLAGAPGRYDSSAYLQDTVAVGIVMPESAGHMEDWSDFRMNCVVSKIQTGMNWWKAHGGTKANLSFVYDIHRSVPTQYEPIDRGNNEVGLWIAENMTSMGFGGSDYWEQVYDYTDYLRSYYHTKWAMVYFVADSNNDADGKFKNSQYFAWTTLGGPYIVMTYRNDGWGIANMNWVAAHEFGHDFGAADQYYQAGYGGCTSTTQRYGYLGVANSNCTYNNSSSVPSIMRSNENAIEASASGQIGWKDSNGNGINDVVDTSPAFNLPAHTPDPTTLTSWSYSGTVYDQPWPHAVCGVSDECNTKDITINTIKAVTFRVDSGGWNNVTPVDGAFDSNSEQITFTTPVLSVAAHTIEVKATNSRNVSKSWTDSVTVTPCYTLTIADNPSYAGSVNRTATNCSGSRYNPGTVVSLNAIANAGYIFSSWAGGASGTNASTSVTMSSNKSVTANFNNRAPTLTSIDPSSAAAGDIGFTLTLTGTNFVQNSVARWNGAALATTYGSSTQLTASIPTGNLAAGGTFPVTVFNPTPGGGTSGAKSFIVNNPAPTLSSIDPTSTIVGSSFTLTANGTSFTPTSKMRWNGADLTTTYVNATQLTASVPAATVTASGSANITVFNPTPGGGTSTQLPLAINNPTPILSNVAPGEVKVGSTGLTITAHGSNFVNGATVRWNGADLVTTYVNAATLTAAVPDGDLASLGNAQITVFNPSPVGGVSGEVELEIVEGFNVFLPLTVK